MMERRRVCTVRALWCQVATYLQGAGLVVLCCFAAYRALAPDFITANSLIAGLMGGFFLFSGYFIAKKVWHKHYESSHLCWLLLKPWPKAKPKQAN